MKNKKHFIRLLKRSLYIAWSLFLLLILAIIVERNYTYAEYIAKQNAITSTNKDIAYRSWVASHGGVYVPVDKKTPPNRYLKNIKNRDFTAIGKKFTLMNPAYSLSQIMKDYSSLYGVKTKITSTRLLNPANRPDEWETFALNKIERTAKHYSQLSDINGEKYLRLMSPLVTTKSCLECHAFQGYKIGDIRGGVSVTIPMRPLYQNALHNSLLIGLLFFMIWLVGILSITFFIKKIYKYLNEKETLYEEYIYGLVNVVEKRDTYTAGHSNRVAHYAELIAKKMGFSTDECHLLYRAGMLHDIGKVAIPDSVFLKPSKLTNQEYSLIQEHVSISYDMLKNISIFDEIKEIVRDHHEHFDGSGYPRGLLGENTPILAQILTLADSFDAMTTDRIYKGRKSVKEALLEIAQLSGKQFNPTVVQAALIALKDVVLEFKHKQNPSTLLEKERFSYFYKDPLTHLYNEAYLRSDLEILLETPVICWVSLKNFHQYNKKYSWNQGDKLLQDFAYLLLENTQENNHIYRLYGDNFLLLLQNEQEAEEISTIINTFLTEHKLEYSYKIAKSNQLDKDNLGNLEDALQKLF